MSLVLLFFLYFHSTLSCLWNNYSQTDSVLPALLQTVNTSTNLTFFDEHCSAVLGISAADLRTQMLELGEEDPKSYPLLLDKMLDKEYALRIKINKAPFYSLSVQRSSLDPEYIQAIKDQLQENEGTSKIADCNIKVKQLIPAEESPKQQKETDDEMSQFATQSLSAMSENDLDKVSNITPAKRNSDEGQADEDITEIGSAQLSTNKMKNTNQKLKLHKTIKTE